MHFTETVTEESDDQLDAEVQRISRGVNGGRAYTPNSSSAGSSSEGLLQNVSSNMDLYPYLCKML